jgi:hypothetical protein
MAWKWICISALGAAILFAGDMRVITQAHAAIDGATTAPYCPPAERLLAKAKRPTIKRPKPSGGNPPCKCWHMSGGKKTCHPCG